jgi:hypothetical protein
MKYSLKPYRELQCRISGHHADQPQSLALWPNAAVRCAGAVDQRLRQSPSSKPSEASRQRHLDGLLGPLFFLSDNFQRLCPERRPKIQTILALAVAQDFNE